MALSETSDRESHTHCLTAMCTLMLHPAVTVFVDGGRKESVFPSDDIVVPVVKTVTLSTQRDSHDARLSKLPPGLEILPVYAGSAVAADTTARVTDAECPTQVSRDRTRCPSKWTIDAAINQGNVGGPLLPTKIPHEA